MASKTNFGLSDESRQRMQRALVAPAVLTSPLWLSLSAITSVGVAWWMISRLTKPINLEALMAKPASKPASTPVSTPVSKRTLKRASTPFAPVDIVIDAAPEAVVVAVVEPALEVAPVPQIETTAEVAAHLDFQAQAEVTADDLTRLVGVGPKLALALAERGVTSFAQLAAWTADDLTAIDTELKLMGRPMRNGWVDQAARFIAEG